MKKCIYILCLLFLTGCGSSSINISSPELAGQTIAATLAYNTQFKETKHFYQGRNYSALVNQDNTITVILNDAKETDRIHVTNNIRTNLNQKNTQKLLEWLAISKDSSIIQTAEQFPENNSITSDYVETTDYFVTLTVLNTKSDIENVTYIVTIYTDKTQFEKLRQKVRNS